MSNSGFIYPAEWEKQASTWLTWPCNPNTWGGERLTPIRQFYCQLMALILQYQPVDLLVPSVNCPSLQDLPKGKHHLRLHQISTNDIWIRDYGPIFVKRMDNRITEIIDFQFNAWGGKFPPWDADNKIPATLAKTLNMPLHQVPFIVEGGALELNGAGACLCTLDCLVGTGRHTEKDLPHIKDALNKYLGVQELLLLESGLHGDHTDGHIDNVARFVAPHTIVLCQAPEDKNDPNQKRLQQALKLLQEWRPAGQKLQIHLLPLPPQRIIGGEILPASYANFIYVNNAIIMPTYQCAQDIIALELLQSLHPHLTVHGFDCSMVIQEGGSLHCLSKQQPFIC